jgi:hypothetical protein
MQKASLVLGGLFLGVLAASFVGCEHSAPFAVEKAQLGEKSKLVTGDNMRLSRPAQEGYDGIKPGYYVVRTVEEWRALFERGQESSPPLAADFTRNMIVVSAGTHAMTKTHVTRVLDTANTIHVYVQDTLRGAGCKNEKGTLPPFEVAITDRIDKPIRVHVDTEESTGCGTGPTATVKCRLVSGQNWSEKVSASPGAQVECEAITVATGAFAVVDKSWSFSELPGGSTTKMTFSRENTRVSFTVDIFGNFKPTFEVADEADRRGSASGVVEVLPPKSTDPFVQMLWAGFDASDDPSTFPRVELFTHDMPTGKGQKERKCDIAASPKPDFCDMKREGAVTNLKLVGAAGKPFIMGVHYTDDRYDGGPYICLRVYLNGVRTADTCDRTKRGADDTWSLGALDTETGTFMDAATAFAKARGQLDGGAPPAGDGGAPAASDAGAPPPKQPKVVSTAKPPPPPPAPKK